MTNRKRILILLLFLLFGQGMMANSHSKRVLLINSYSPDFPTYNNIHKAINEASGDLSIDIEFLYGKEHSNRAYFKKLQQLFAEKISLRPPYDVLVTVDNIALQFVLGMRDSLFRDIPIVFCGVEDRELLQQARLAEGVSGITEFCAFGETIGLAARLNPDLNEIVALTDNTITGVANFQLFNAYCTQFSEIACSNIDFGRTTYNDALKQLSKVTGDKALLLISAYRDSTSAYTSFQKALSDILRVSQVPVYHLYEHGIGQGIVGGKPISHYHMLKKVFDKIKASSTEWLMTDTSIVNMEPVEFIVDFAAVNHFNLSEKAIPDSAIILNKPTSFFKIEKSVLYLALVLVGFLLLFVVYLSITVRNRRRMNYELMLAKEKAEESNRLKTAFIANMSHEIRTPMNSIVGFSSLLRSTDLNYETRGQYCQIIEDNSNHLLALISDIIDISKIESGDFSFRLSKIEVLPILKSQVLEYQQKIVRLTKPIELKLNSEIGKDFYIVSDKVRFKQLLSNLLGNALKYTTEGEIELGCKLKNSELLIYVKDTGIGISADFLPKIFERFMREEDAKKVYDGTGLGLAIAKSIVQKWNGKIWVESEKGKGSTFYFTCPLQ